MGSDRRLEALYRWPRRPYCIHPHHIVPKRDGLEARRPFRDWRGSNRAVKAVQADITGPRDLLKTRRRPSMGRASYPSGSTMELQARRERAATAPRTPSTEDTMTATSQILPIFGTDLRRSPEPRSDARDATRAMDRARR
ncbi:MAG: hypothetical protein IAG13_18570 [Deltaproteobacteria bacterium]|nr:hypothetical protein [Nannocystaceae bacterium]